MLKKASFYAIVLGFLCASAYAQFWPLPNYTTPDTQVPCSQCETTALNMPTPGWHDPVVRYVGRFVSSEYVADFQQVYRTARAGGVVFSPDGTRIGIKLGNGVATFSTANFLSLLDAHTPLVSAATLGVSSGNRFNGPIENFLAFERFFYAESSAAGWTLAFTDGQDRLNGFDMDDRGLIYPAYRQFGWGVASDLPNTIASTNPAPLMSSWQDKNAQRNWSPVTQVFWIKDGTDYYALAQNQSQATTHLFKVPSYSTVTEVNQDLRFFTGAIGKPILYLARGNNNKTAVVVSSRTQLFIYDNHNLVTNGPPVGDGFDYSGAGALSDVVYDGTNWWVSVLSYSGFHFMLSRISPDGNGGFTRTNFPTNYGGALSMRYKDGYIAAVTSDADGQNIRLYKVTSGTPVEQPTVSSINSYFKTQTGFAPIAPHMTIQSANPLLVNGKLYLIVNGDGIGDVYQIRTDDTVNITFQGTAGPANANAPARTPGDVFYGDAVKMTATLSSGGTGGPMTWNFGAANDPGHTQAGIFGTQVTHQYTGLTKNDTALPLTVTGTNNANSVTGTAQLTLKTGTARVKYGSSTGTKYLIGSGTPIVMDDSFYDASDGDTPGHYVEWRTGSDPQYTDPTTAVAVGACGQHTLSMTAHYGYAAPGANNVDYPSAISPFTYNVLSFSPGVDVSYNTATGNEEFFSTSRAAALLAGRTFTYTWDVVDSNGAAVTAIPPQSGTTTSIDTIPRFNVSKALFTLPGYKGRLTLSVSGADPCSQAGGPIASAQATSPALVTPDAQLNPSCSLGVCTFTVSSPSNVMQSDAWTFAWTATGGSPAAGSGSSLTTSYFTIGNYTVQVVVTNKTGLTKTLTTTANITTAASQCPTFTLTNTFINYVGTAPGSACAYPATCQPNEQIQFSVGYFPVSPDQSCQSTLTYAWLVDNAPPAGGGTGPTFTTGLPSGSHVIACTLKAGNQTLNMTLSINIGTVTPPPPPPPPPNQCGTLTNQNVYVDYSGTTPACQIGGSCGSGETITFDAHTWNFQPGSCTVSYSWSFDGGAGVAGGSEVTHTFSTPGNHTVACTVRIAGSQGLASATVVIGGGTTPTCPTLAASQNVFFDYTGATTGCTSSNSKHCVSNEQIAFTITYWNYQVSCGTHHYTWKVDGATVSGSDVTNTLALSQGTHTVSVTIDNGNPTPTTLSQTVTIDNGVKPNYSFDFNITPLALPQFSYAFSVVVTPDTPSKPTQWQWNFGDGSPAVTAGAIQTHTFPDDNEYTVTVTATDGSGGIVSHTIQSPPARRRGVRH